MLNKYTNTLQSNKGIETGLPPRLEVGSMSNGYFIKSSHSFPTTLRETPSAASASVLSSEAFIIIYHIYVSFLFQQHLLLWKTLVMFH